jgi:MinD-like ATPase involved in chromosome partitioning or flagellar assembly
MASQRYVLLGLGRPRSPWFSDVARWATSATIAAEFVKCVTPEEVRARLASGRRHSALLVDAGLPGFDRDLVAVAAAASTPTIAIGPAATSTWSPADLGVAGVLPARFSAADLLGALEAHARMLSRADDLPPALAEPAAPLWKGRLFAVTGPGGTGASVTAIALAQTLAGDPRYHRRVLLADLARRADQAMLHDAGDLGPGLQEMVDSHRLSRPDRSSIESGTFAVPARGYRLLLGLRQPEAWSVVRPRSFDAALAGLRSTFDVMVADITGDFEGEPEGGSIDVEERNYMARATAAAADVVVVVGTPGMKGIHSLAQTIRALVTTGVAPQRVLPAISRAPRNPRGRAEAASSLAALAGPAGLTAGPIPIPERKVEDALRDGAPLPPAVGEPVAAAVHATLDRLMDAAPPATAPQAVAPGSLGRWYDVDEDTPAP